MRPLHASTLVALIGSAIGAVGLFGLGVFAIVGSSKPWLFGLTLALLGVISGALVIGAFQRHRPSWAYLVAIWSVTGICAFFTAPKVLDLPKIEQVTVALEQQFGRQGAEDRIDEINMKARLTVMGVCLGFAAPFAAMCVAFAIGRRDYERIA